MQWIRYFAMYFHRVQATGQGESTLLVRGVLYCLGDGYKTGELGQGGSNSSMVCHLTAPYT